MNGSTLLPNDFSPEDLDPRQSFSHQVSNFQILQTHISWIVLTGDWAYKIKKPVKFDFLDFSTLEKRLTYCRRELEINQCFAPQLYHDVVPITRGANAWEVEGRGPIVDYAVKMTQFPADALLSTQLAAGRVSVPQMSTLAAKVARYHQDAAVVEARDAAQEYA